MAATVRRVALFLCVGVCIECKPTGREGEAKADAAAAPRSTRVDRWTTMRDVLLHERDCLAFRRGLPTLMLRAQGELVAEMKVAVSRVIEGQVCVESEFETADALNGLVKAIGVAPEEAFRSILTELAARPHPEGSPGTGQVPDALYYSWRADRILKEQLSPTRP